MQGGLYYAVQPLRPGITRLSFGLLLITADFTHLEFELIEKYPFLGIFCVHGQKR